MNNDDSSSNDRIPSNDVTRSLETGLPTLDAARATGYGELGILRDAKANSLIREQRLLARKHNSTAHPRIAQARQRFVVNEQLRRELAVARETVETTLPDLEPRTMIVYGFVRRRSDQIGIPGLTLALTTEDGNWVRELGYACTDQRGYFQLIIKFSDPQPVPPIPADPQPDRPAGDSTKVESDTQRPNTILQLRVFDRDGRVLHTETRPVFVRPEAVDYRLILIGDKEAESSCTPPPAKTGGQSARAVPVNPKPEAPLAPPPSAAAPQQHVSSLKTYTQPPIGDLVGRSTPLEANRGIGPAKAGELRTAGKKDVTEYSETPGAELVKIAGFNKVPPEQPTEPAPEKKESGAEKQSPVKKKKPGKSRAKKPKG